MIKLKYFMILVIVVFLSGFTNLTEQVAPPKGIPKRTEDVNAGIVIPSWDCTPHDVIKYSYDRLDALILDPEKGIIMSLSTSNFDLNPHKLTFYQKKYGFVTHQAYRVGVLFDTETQKIINFAFSPFEITVPKPESEVKVIADKWVEFFDSLGWKRGIDSLSSYKPYGTIPERGCWTYQAWEDSGMRQSVGICLNEFVEDKSVPKYYINIVFMSNINREI